MLLFFVPGLLLLVALVVLATIGVGAWLLWMKFLFWLDARKEAK